MQKQVWTWSSQWLHEPARMARWGHFGTPVLVFPTAGGDFEEIERFQLLAALGPLIEGGRIKVYSVDAGMVRDWLLGTVPPEQCARTQDAYDAFIHEEAVSRIRQDCQDEHIEPILAGASLGAFAAVGSLCRHPATFRLAIGLSGTYDLARRLGGVRSSDVGAFSLLPFLGGLEGPQLQSLRGRLIVLGSGEGGYETPAESRDLAQALEAKGVPHSLSLWGVAHDHTWTSWREMLPRTLTEHL